MASSSSSSFSPSAGPALERLPACFWGPPTAAAVAEWGWPPARGALPQEPSLAPSPASSPESGAGSLSPADGPPLRMPAARRRGRLGDGQRQSASQREKLRMRRLARALHTLRRFLPPSVAPAGQSLTKIETLRLAIRYIAHLSDLLGLRPETLAWRGAAAAAARARRCCPLCPPGLGCCQPPGPPPRTPPPGPPAAPCRLQAPAAPSSGPVPVAAEAAPWLADPHGDLLGTPLDDRPGSRALAAAAQPPQVDFSAQGLPAELLSFLESLLPPDAQD
ncbi:UNVERIFIED_CONTAM: hypothetical protein K2H54_020606 [Gekko kuhli]